RRELVVRDEEDEAEPEVGEEGDLLDHRVVAVARVRQHADRHRRPHWHPDQKAEQDRRLEESRAGHADRRRARRPDRSDQLSDHLWSPGTAMPIAAASSTASRMSRAGAGAREAMKPIRPDAA